MLSIPVFATPTIIDLGWEFGFEVAGSIALAGLTTTAAVFLLSERILRPAVGLALDAETPPETRSLGIGARLILTWLLCSGVPIVMLALIPIGREETEAGDLIVPMLFVAGAGLWIGLFATKLATLTVTRPVRQMRKAVDSVREGDLDVTVTVDDGSELGRLQAGFNAMVAGLRERELLHDLFGRQVGLDVAREALETQPALGGRTQTISALFVDVIGSTSLAERESPERVVELLNQFFELVVGVVDEHGGMVNKFEGDAALCVFGAPIEQPDHAARALAAARAMRDRLSTDRRPARRRDRRGLRRGRRRLRRGRVALRVHGHRRPGERGLAADRAGQAEARAAARQRRDRGLRGRARGRAAGRSTARSRCAGAESPTRLAIPARPMRRRTL